MNKNLYILGGGPAGMSAAYYANKYNMNFKLFEATNTIGGNCRTIKINSFKFDTGAHRFHDKIPKVTAEIKKILGKDLLKVSAPSKIYWNNQFINFPLKIIDILQFADYNTIFKIIKETVFNQFSKPKKYINFKDFAYHSYGKTISELFLINYSEKLWGISTDMLSTDISGGRLKHLTLSNLLKDMIYKNEDSEHLDGTFYYPRNGYGTIFESMKSITGEHNIKYNTPITKLIHDNYKIKKIISNKETISINNSKIISTLPLTTIINILDPKPPQEIFDSIQNLSYQSLKLCIIMIDKKRISNNASIYFPNKNIPFTRLYEPKNRSESLAPKNQTAIVIEVPYNKKNIDDNILKKIIISYLNKKKFFTKDEILDSKIITIPYAYPILIKGLNKKIKLAKNYLMNFKNLNLLGRNAHFKYLHTHDLIFEAENQIKHYL